MITYTTYNTIYAIKLVTNNTNYTLLTVQYNG